MSFDNGQCLNFSDARSLAAMAPAGSNGNTSVPLLIRLAQAYLIFLNYLETTPRTYVCHNRPPFENQSDIYFDLHHSYSRNLVVDRVPQLCYTVANVFKYCHCIPKWRMENDTIEQCFIRKMPQLCNCPLPFTITGDDYQGPYLIHEMKVDLTRKYGQEYTAARVLYCISFIGALVGCSLSLLIYMKSPGLQTVANIFIINLILASCVITLLAIPVQILETILRVPYPWIIPKPLWLADVSCRAYYFIRYLGFYATSYSLALIGYERYNPICKPLESQRQFSKKRALKLVGATWLLSAILTIPTLFSHGLIFGTVFMGYEMSCGKKIHGEAIMSHRTLYTFTRVYEMFLSTTSFFIPSIILSITYINVLIVLVKRNQNRTFLTDDKDVSGFTSRGALKKKSKSSTSESQTRRATWMCFACLATFVLLWIPFHTISIIGNAISIDDDVAARISKLFSFEVKALFLFPGYERYELLNSIGTLFAFFNPLIYCASNKQWINAAKFLFGFQTTVEQMSGVITQTQGQSSRMVQISNRIENSSSAVASVLDDNVNVNSAYDYDDADDNVEETNTNILSRRIVS